MTDMKQLTKEQRCAVVRCLVDGVSIRATGRITGAAKNTIQKLTKDLGEAVLAYQDEHLRNIISDRIQCDEVWAFCYAKDKNLPDAMRGMPGVGSIWTWTAMCADTKLMISWRLGARDASNAQVFISDLAERLASRVQHTTDGNRLYVNAVDDAFQGDVDYAQLIKLYGNEQQENRYSPGLCLGSKKSRKRKPFQVLAKVATVTSADRW